MATVRLFAAARTAAGVTRDEIPGDTVAEVLRAATQRYGAPFAEVLGSCAIWVDGQPVGPDHAVDHASEVAILPPVSGGDR